MMIPRSRSRSILSRNCSLRSRSESAPVASRIRSASVDFPWSMCAMIEKLRMKRGSAAMEDCRGIYNLLDIEKRLLTRQMIAVLQEHQLDALADVLGDRHFGLRVELLERGVLLGRDVDRGGNLLTTHSNTLHKHI